MTFKQTTQNKTNNNSKSKWKKVGAILKSKNGNGFYIKIDEGITLSKGQTLNVQNPRDRIQSLADSGKITEKEAEERLAKIPDFVRYEVFLVE